ncbi:MAG: ABC transporter permease [Treponema sp.]|jgi:ribose transport system permease protein|nr:ABC transporter permease [Treponema sp.]
MATVKFTMRDILNLLQKREVSLLLIISVLSLFLAGSTQNFLKPANFRVLLQGMSTDMMIAIPMGISLIAGNIDFSVGSNLCLTSAITGLALNNGMGTYPAILMGLIIGILLGLINAVNINHLKLPPLVATLGTWMAYRGLALVVLGGGTLSRFPDNYLILGRTVVFGIPITIIYMFAVIFLGVFALKYINFFHNAYFIGTNKMSATLAGIDRTKFIYVSYALTGFIAAFAGIIMAARLGSATQNAGVGLEFRIVVGLLVGGISMDGGEGSLIGMVLGVLLMQLVGNAIVLLYLNPSYTQVINGFILVAAIAVDMLIKQGKSTIRISRRTT